MFCLLISFSLKAEVPHLIFASANIKNVSEQHTDYNAGVAVDLLDKMSQQLGFSYDIHFYPWSRAIQIMKQGKADALIGVYYTDNRAATMDYGKVAIYQDEIRLYTKYPSEFDWQGDINQLSGLSISLMRGASYGRALDHFKGNMQVVEVSSVEQQFRLLNKGRVELTANNVRTTEPVLQQLKLEYNFQSYSPAIALLPGYFAFAKSSKHKALLAKFDDYMMQLHNSTELKELQQVHLPAN